jgi:NAD(P)-dependent dehydrogenase (short-subunit alcohol dehydrogenase family)
MRFPASPTASPGFSPSQTADNLHWLTPGSADDRNLIRRWSAYTTAKSAQIGLTRSWARELAPSGITVNTVAPGFIPVERHAGLFALRLLDRAQVPAVIYAADPEDNRVLSLLAAFRFYRPWALVSKRASGAEIRKLVTAEVPRTGKRPRSSRPGGLRCANRPRRNAHLANAAWVPGSAEMKG